jgi:hypothetical protein
MAISKDAARQYPLVAEVRFDAADIPAVAVYEAVDLPAGAVVTGGVFEVITTDAGGGTVKVQIGAVELLGATATSAASRTFITETAVATTAVDTVDVEVETAVLTTFAGRLTIEYIIEGKANEVNP